MELWCSTIFVYMMLVSVCPLEALITLPENVTIPALFAFGDSIVDPGNNNGVSTIIKCNFRPYGIDFMGGKPTGRFCNGKIPTDFIAKQLGLKELLPAYLDPSLNRDDLLTGVSFASGGAGYDPLTSQIVNVIGMSEQLKLFKEYIGKLKQIAGEKRSEIILKDSVYIVVAGNNDLAINYFDIPLSRYKYDVDAYTDFLVQKVSSFIQELYDLGTRKLGVFSAPPIGCLPAQRTLTGDKTRECSEIQNQAASLYNSKLYSQLQTLDKNLKGGKVIYIDIYNPLLDIINNPTYYGFEVANKGCCGTGNIEVAILCNDLTSPICDDVSKHLFWDSFHPTEKAYEIIVDLLLKKYVNFLL